MPCVNEGLEGNVFQPVLYGSISEIDAGSLDLVLRGVKSQSIRTLIFLVD